MRETGNSNSLTNELFELMCMRGERLRVTLKGIEENTRSKEELEY